HWPDMIISFFFQAEDGIRDRNVTGVQTCALPILTFPGRPLLIQIMGGNLQCLSVQGNPNLMCRTNGSAGEVCNASWSGNTFTWRSEERRVGKEGRSEWGSVEMKEGLTR